MVAVVNQIGDASPSANLEQTYNGFAPADGNSTLYAPIALHEYYGFNSSFQVQNISGAVMDICATYSDDLQMCVSDVADSGAATFLQGDETHEVYVDTLDGLCELRLTKEEISDVRVAYDEWSRPWTV